MNMTPEAQKLVNQYISELQKTFSDCGKSSDRFFSLTEPRSIALRKALLESTEFLSFITCMDVPHPQGQVVTVGESTLRTGRVKSGRFAKGSGIKGNEFKLVETDSCCVITWEQLAIWANAGSPQEFFNLMNSAAVTNFALDMLRIGFNGKEAAENSDPESHPNGEDVNIGWHEIAKKWGEQPSNTSRILTDAVTRVALNNEKMTLTWERLTATGTPVSKSPLRRQMETQFPELASGTLHTRLARVIAPTEPTTLGDVADSFRPRYAVDVQLLDENGNDKSDTPVYPAVPLPVPMAGSEAGCFAYPPAGTIVEISNIEGRPDKPVIRQILPAGHNLPDVKPGEQLQQQRAEVFQRVTTDGSWHRETDQQIREHSARRTINSDQEERTTTTRTTTVQANDITSVLGTSKLMTGQTEHITTGHYAIAAGEHIQMVAQDLLTKLKGATSTIERDLTENVGGRRTCRADGGLEFTAPTVFIGRGGSREKSGLNLLTLLIDILDLVQLLATHTANHTHSNTGAPTNSSELAADAKQATSLREKYGDLIA